MPLPKGKSREDCISKSYKEMRASGRPHDQAQAAALNHCNKIYGGIPKKEANEIISKILLEEMKDLIEKYQKKWIQKAVPPSHKGKFTEWCKRHGFKGVTGECIRAAVKQGGHAAKMANFARTMRKMKR